MNAPFIATLTFICVVVSMMVFIISSHIRSNIKENNRFAKIELLTLIVCLSFHLGASQYLFHNVELTIRTTLIGLTAVFGVFVPIVTLALPAQHRIVSIISMLATMPFAWLGLALNVFGLINTWFFIIYFTVPLIIGIPMIFFAIKSADNCKKM